jgi:hypothetical protein
MTPDVQRLCEAVEHVTGNNLSEGDRLFIVSAVLLALKELTGETPRYAAGEWSRRNVEAMVADILGEPATA